MTSAYATDGRPDTLPKPHLLVAIALADSSRQRLAQDCIIHQATTHAERMRLAQDIGPQIQAILTNGTTSIPAELIAALPHLRLICSQGVGFEGIDLPAARRRGIAVSYGPGTNAECVADHAMAILLAAIRNVVGNDAVVRAGRWRTGDTMPPAASGKRVGILGLGDIGSRIARRCAAFNMPVAYHNRRRVADAPWPYMDSARALAHWADILMIVLPGGANTKHLIGAAEIAALGPEGFLVNVGRGSVVDTAALIASLRAGGLAGAALDVVENEPGFPKELYALPNVVLTPHMAGRSPESVRATIELVCRNIRACFTGQPLLTPVPDTMAAGA